MVKTIQILGAILILILLANLALFSFVKLDWKIFWGVIIAVALIAFLVLPRIPK